MDDSFTNQKDGSTTERRGFQFWIILVALSITSILAALDLSIISTALPTIVHDLGSSSAYVWVANAYILSSTVFQPLYGQMGNIVGRRSLIIFSVSMFCIGSVICGSAKSLTILIVGRTIQGVGCGGINVLVAIVVGDLVPLRKRPKYMGIVFSGYSVAITLGPVLGGVMTENISWRWIFYMNLPIGGVALILLGIFLKTNRTRRSIKDAIIRIDFIGNAVLIPSVISILLALEWGGTLHPWSSWRTLVPLILGFLGLIAFEPTMPRRLFSFFQAMLVFWISYYLPVYFQAVLADTPTASGVDILPTAITSMPFAIAAGWAVSRFRRYRPFHFIGTVLTIIAFGLFSRLDTESSTGYWVGVQIIGAVGTGVLVTTVMPAIHAPLEESDQAVATATWSFLRGFGGALGVAIASAAFNSRFDTLLSTIDSPPLRQRLANGGAYASASKTFIESLNPTPQLKAQVLGMYVNSLKLTWEVGLGFAFVCFVSALFVQEISLREKLKTEFGGSSRGAVSLKSGENIENHESNISLRPTTGGSSLASDHSLPNPYFWENDPPLSATLLRPYDEAHTR
ncbi:multidrug resistance protein Fnx1 [Xylogone sp. PMI_703]|nr:multidrug resistance protein Fnx1 [Xylogone sp. PMI_703]